MKRLFITIILCAVCAVIYADSTFVTHCKVTTYKAKDGAKTRGGISVDNKKVKNGQMNIVAVSRDLLWCIPLGSIIEVEGHGKFEVRDTTAGGLKHVVDILVHKDADTWMETGVKIKLLKKGSGEVNNQK